MSLKQLKNELNQKANPQKAQILQRFFKTGPGEYGEGDIFLGITVPQLRNFSKKYAALSLSENVKLLKSPTHEERLLALFILIIKFSKNDPILQKKIYHIYLNNTNYINNWDLVDLSAPKVLGAYLFNKDKKILFHLAKSYHLWERRIAILATFYFIKQDLFSECLKISKILIKDKEDLIHKAVGWMLREIGKRNLSKEETFLKAHYLQMPRTMLRYAIEKFPEDKRQAYLKGTI